MTCQDMMDLMQRSLDLDLSAAEEQAMLAHLQGCPDCADLFERLKLLTGELAQLPKVTPPYSIVDSILPQLESLGGLAEPGAAADVPVMNAPVDELAARREKKGLISWKIVSGVAAAGIVLGMVIFNGGVGQVDDKTAQEMADSSQFKQSSASMGSVANTGKAQLPEMMAYDQAGTTTPAASAAAAAGSDNGSAAKSTEKPAASQPDATARDGRQVSAASRGEGVAQDPVKVIDQYGVSGSTKKQETSETKSDAAGAGTADSNTALTATSGAAEKPETTPAPGSQNAVPQQEQPKSGDAAKGMESGALLLAAPEVSPAPSGGSMDSNREAVRSLTSMKTAVPTIQPMASGDGVYTAQLVELSVTITVNDGSELFRSGVQLAAGDVLTFKGWSEGGFFTYSIKKPDGKETTYRISITDKKEIVM
jgi:hypothetical protein